MHAFLLGVLGGALGHMAWDFLKSAKRYRWTCPLCEGPMRYTAFANTREALDLAIDSHTDFHLQERP